MKDPLLVNKIAAAVLVALLLFMVVGLVGEGLVSPKPIDKNSFVIATAETGAAATSAAAPAAAAELPPIAPLLAAANLAAGQETAKKCQTCHNFVKDGPNGVGPNLWGIVGRKVASHEGYAYSSAMKGQAENAWDFEKLNHFMAKPQAVVPGTKMAFAGLSKAEDRANVLLYLRSLADSPVKLP
ncbi:MAG: cytochrome c family protein [Candidatus Pacebacteria bacterium]|nr:cytochrome c family protein [Candidatus Paceibacterota bacterium]